MRPVLSLSLIVVLVAGVLIGALWVGQRRLMYFPFGDVPPPADVGLPAAEPVTFTTSDGLTLRGWFVEAETPASTARGPVATVLVCNGNAGNRAFRAPLARALAGHGVSVLLFDYRGFGGNPGAPHEAGLRRDARAALAWLRARPDADPGRLVYFGESLGAAVAVDLAADEPPAALVLRSPFTSMTDVAATHYPLLPVRWLLRDRYEVLARIGAIRVPTLVIAGDRDRIVPFAQSRRVHEALPDEAAFHVMEGLDHNDAALTAGREMVAVVVDFVRAHLPARRASG